MNDEEDLPSEIDTIRDLCGLQTRDVTSRLEFLELLGKTLKAWTNRHQENGENGFENFSSSVLPCILRLSFRSPFSDIRERCTELLLAVKVRNMWSIGSSHLCHVYHFLWRNGRSAFVIFFSRKKVSRFLERFTRGLRYLFRQKRYLLIAVFRVIVVRPLKISCIGSKGQTQVASSQCQPNRYL